MAARITLINSRKLASTGLASSIRKTAPFLTSSKQSVLSYGLTQPASRRPFSASIAHEVKKYSEDHEWVELDSDGTTGTVGISTYAAKALGDVVYVELPIEDTDVAKGDTIGAVESVKSASDILTPVSGKILETNKMLEEKPGSINKSPESEAWIMKIKVADMNDFDTLMDKDAYAKFTEE